MNRAALLIGIGNAKWPGPLPAVAECIVAMQAWVASQPGFGTGGNLRLKVLSDDVVPVSQNAIYNAVQEFIDKGTIDQLIIYFVGHGIMRGRDEFWFCSHADRNPNELIDVPNSRQHARACGIPHVIFLSDACRTTTSDSRLAYAGGANIFPYPDHAAKHGYVDLLYGASVGEATLEVEIPGTATRHESVFTSAVLAGLRGEIPRLNQVLKDELCVFVQDLAVYLEEAVPARLAQLGLHRRIQRPDDEVTSRHPQTISLLGKACSRGESIDSTSAPTTNNKGYDYLDSTKGGSDRLAPAPQAPVPNAAVLRLQRRLLAAPLVRRSHWKSLRNGQASVRASGVVNFITAADSDGYRRRAALHMSVDGWRTVLLEFGDGKGLAVPLVAGHELRVRYDTEKHAVSMLHYRRLDDDMHGATFQRRHEMATLASVRTAAIHGGPVMRDEKTLRMLVDYLLADRPPDPMLYCLGANVLSKTVWRDEVGTLDERFNQWYGFHLCDLHALVRAPDAALPMGSGINPMPMTSRVWNILETAFGSHTSATPALALKHMHCPIAQSFWTLLEPVGVEAVQDLLKKRKMT